MKLQSHSIWHTDAVFILTTFPGGKECYFPTVTVKDWKPNRWIAAHPCTRAQDNESQSWCILILLMSPLRNIFLGESSLKHKVLLQQADFVPLWQAPATSDPWVPLVVDFSCIHSFTCQHSVCTVCSQLLSGLGSLEKCGRICCC